MARTAAKKKDPYTLSINRMGIKRCREISDLLDNRKRKLEKLLVEALPENLRGKYGNRDEISNLVWNGGCSFSVIRNVGRGLSENDQNRLFQQAREILKPVAEAWAKYGIVLDEEISYHDWAIDQEIEAHFSVR